MTTGLSYFDSRQVITPLVGHIFRRQPILKFCHLSSGPNLPMYVEPIDKTMYYMARHCQEFNDTGRQRLKLEYLEYAQQPTRCRI